MTEAAQVVIPEPPQQVPRLVTVETPEAVLGTVGTRSGGRRAIRWIAVGLAVVLIAGLGFALVRQTGRLADAREQLAAGKATIGGLQTQVKGMETKIADVTEAKDGLAGDVARLESSVGTCREAAQAGEALSGSVREMIGAAYVGDRSGFMAAFRQAARLQRQADGAASSCLRATDGDISTL